MPITLNGIIMFLALLVVFVLNAVTCHDQDAHCKLSSSRLRRHADLRYVTVSPTLTLRSWANRSLWPVAVYERSVLRYDGPLEVEFEVSF